jgi:hypothetical protein
MKTLLKYFGIAGCLVCITSGNAVAASSPSVQIDTTIPAADGMITTDQIPPLMMPTETTTAPSATAQPAPQPAPTAGTPVATH